MRVSWQLVGSTSSLAFVEQSAGLRFRAQTGNGLRAGLIQRSERPFPRSWVCEFPLLGSVCVVQNRYPNILDPTSRFTEGHAKPTHIQRNLFWGARFWVSCWLASMFRSCRDSVQDKMPLGWDAPQPSLRTKPPAQSRPSRPIFTVRFCGPRTEGCFGEVNLGYVENGNLILNLK